MYFFKNTLRNQQKNRKNYISINKHHWAQKNIFFKNNYLFFIKNQLSVDLRFYKLILRKLKKKILKKNIKIFIYLYPNKKITNKSKNSRMGKGKGLFNRYAFYLKKTKPILIFKNLKKKKIIKLIYFLNKFFKYKIIKC